ncbi:S-(hydroxymethyl)glutathione dehydrogenase / alcohol dehydrogenase [Thermoflexales bacterium]|nr:S-(hydroxymethyl)glutathione dehydrogenase / alcohol dehydrogenase [Thermoflexales bacterium]
MKIQAALITAPQQPIQIEMLELDPPRAGEVLVQIKACGVCHSDYHLISGATKHPLPVVPGHEGAGIVEAVGDGVTRIQPGDHVVLNWAPSCGHCFYCLRGKPNLCDTFVGPIWNGVMLDGTPRLRWNDQPVYHFSALAAFAEYAVVPQETCVVIRNDVLLSVAALVGCAVTTGVGAVLYSAQVQAGDRVAVFGCGGVGLSVILGAQLAGAQQIIAIDRVPQKLELAKQFGATDVIDASKADAVALVRQLTAGRGADVTFEVTGVPQLQTAGVEAARPGGKAVWVGLSAMESSTSLSGAQLVRQEKTVIGSYYGSAHTARDFPFLLDLYAAGKLNLDRLISRTYRLVEINAAFEAMLNGEVARGVVTF